MSELTEQEKKKFAGRCGLYCGACGIYRSEREHPETQKAIADDIGCKSEQVKCNGCGDLLEDSWGFDCKIIKCQNDKGFSTCAECPDLDTGNCELLEGLASGYMKIGMDVKANLRLTKDGKTDQWVEEANRNFTCSHCNKPTMYWSVNCHHCGMAQKT